MRQQTGNVALGSISGTNGPTDGVHRSHRTIVTAAARPCVLAFAGVPPCDRGLAGGSAGGQVLQEAYPRGSVTVAADVFLQDTTSHGAAGLWEPYKLGAPPSNVYCPSKGTLMRAHACPAKFCPS